MSIVKRKACAVILGIQTCIAAPAAAEIVKLTCILDRGWTWTIDINLEKDELISGAFPPVSVTQAGDKWIVAHQTISGDPPRIESWIINRHSGELWHSSFAEFCADPEGNFCAPSLATYGGTCRARL